MALGYMRSSRKAIFPTGKPHPTTGRRYPTTGNLLSYRRWRFWDTLLWELLPLVGYQTVSEELREERLCLTCSQHVARTVMLPRALAAFAQRVGKLEQDARALAETAALQDAVSQVPPRGRQP